MLHFFYFDAFPYPIYHQTWPIEVREGQKIELIFEDFDVEGYTGSWGYCAGDWVDVDDGIDKKRYCGYTLPPPIISSGNTMAVTLHSDGDENARGFRAIWRTVDERLSKRSVDDIFKSAS